MACTPPIDTPIKFGIACEMLYLCTSEDKLHLSIHELILSAFGWHWLCIRNRNLDNGGLQVFFDRFAIQYYIIVPGECRGYVFVKPDGQSRVCLCYAMEMKGRMGCNKKISPPLFLVARFEFSLIEDCRCRNESRRHILSAETKSLNDGTIAIDVAVVEVVKESTALADELCQ